MHKTFFNVPVTFLKSVHATSGEERLLNDVLLSNEYKEQVLAVRAEQDEDKQKEQKKKLPAFTASGLFGSPVDANHLIKHSGFIGIDIDQKDNAQVSDFAQLKDHIHEIPYIAYCGASCRGEGYFCLIPIRNHELHKEYFRSLQLSFLDCGLVIDASCGDVSRKRFVSYDPEPYVNTYAEVYDFVISEYETIRKHVARMTDVETRRKVEELIHTLCQQKKDITADRSAWFEVLCAIASYFGEEGREYAHKVCQFYPTYSAEETDNKYNDALSHDGYAYNIATLFFHANKALNSAVYQFKDILVYDDDL